MTAAPEPTVPQPTSGVFRGRDHLLPVRVYYEDTDFSGVVYHANYVRYFERGRSDFLRLAGVSHADLFAGETPLAFAVTRIWRPGRKRFRTGLFARRRIARGSS